MISKDLLSEVLDKKITHVSYCEREGIKYNGMFAINIYELAHKCKEYLWKKHNVTLTIDYNWFGVGGIIIEIKKNQQALNVMNFTLDSFDFPNEPDYIFKACQWILKNHKI